jgi:WhiB family redox-sensing transcriptional regulator
VYGRIVSPGSPLFDVTIAEWLREQRPGWMDQAACAGHREVQFVLSHRDAAATRAALAICRSCVVRFDCLDYAIRCDAVGIWGATTTLERRKLAAAIDMPRRRRNAPRRHTAA